MLLLAPLIAEHHGQLDAIALLESGIEKSPWNFQFKLMQMKMYDELGAFVPSHELFNSLKIAYIQNDSLSYLITESALSAGFFEQARKCFGDVCSLRWTTQREVPDFARIAWKNSNYLEILDFVRLDERLRCSHQLAVARAEGHVLNLTLLHLSSVEDVHGFLHNDLHGDRIDTPGLIGHMDHLRGAPSLDALCINYDFEVEGCWRYPFHPRVASQLSVYERCCVTSAAYPRCGALLTVRGYDAWKRRSQEWMKFRISTSKVLFSCP